jgi:light-regulated signal transduction histidine kinase (bacteriophytochrome)
MNDIAGFASEYAAAFERYFQTGDEATLSLAYQLGRQALGKGLGLLDMASAHQRVVETHVLRAPAAEQSRWADRATDFLRELLSPFEMTFRGYRDANRELLRLNEQLAHQKDAVELVNRELESFSYSVSHDLRAPLRAIDRFSQALLEDHAGQLDEDGKKYLRRVRESAGEMAQLIEALLTLARVTRAELSPTTVDLSALAQRISSRFQAAEPTRQTDFVIQQGLTEIGDAPLLSVVLENLLGNAWKFTSKREHARIDFGRSPHPHQGRPEYFVRDNGAGFDMAYADKLFGTFQRLHSTSEFEGTGIGLATVARVVRRHGGSIRAEGAVDRGATFYFTLDVGTPGP